MIFSDLPSPAEAGFAKAGNRVPLFGIMLAHAPFQQCATIMPALPVFLYVYKR